MYIINYTSFTSTAFNPFCPSFNSKVTSSFSLMLSINPVEWTKYSFDESSSLINPKPFESLKNFTVPLFIIIKLIQRKVHIVFEVFLFYAINYELIVIWVGNLYSCVDSKSIFIRKIFHSIILLFLFDQWHHSDHPADNIDQFGSGWNDNFCIIAKQCVQLPQQLCIANNNIYMQLRYSTLWLPLLLRHAIFSIVCSLLLPLSWPI